MSQKTNERQPSSAHEWAHWMEGEVIQLSRFAARVKPPDVLDMMMSDGAVYEALAGMAQRGEQITENNFSVLIEKYPQLKPFLDRMVIASFVEPKVIEGETYDLAQNEIPLSWVHTIDKLAVMGRFLGDFEALGALFPDEQDREVDATSDRESLRTAAKQLGGADAAK